jgi:hypothetical protein
MSSNLRDPKAVNPDEQAQPGLDPDELRAEQAGDLPDRDAMSIISLTGLDGALPPAGIIEDVLNGESPVDALPLDGLPVQQVPVDQLPIHLSPPDIQPPVIEPPVTTLPIDPPVDGVPVEPPVDGDPIAIPDPLDGSVDASIDV